MVPHMHRLHEEQDVGGGYGGVYAYHLPESLSTLKEWFDSTAGKSSYPIYAVVLFDKTCQATMDLVTDSRKSISAAAGEDVCFVYFRDGKTAETLAPWSIDEHIKYAIHFAAILGISLPAIAFFSSLDMREQNVPPTVIQVDLADKSAEQALTTLTGIFSNYYAAVPHGSDKLSCLSLSASVESGRKTILNDAASQARNVATEFFKAAGKALWSTMVG